MRFGLLSDCSFAHFLGKSTGDHGEHRSIFVPAIPLYAKCGGCSLALALTLFAGGTQGKLLSYHCSGTRYSNIGKVVLSKYRYSAYLG
jgi:hypothetical protein